jgi:hypothetical protein
MRTENDDEEEDAACELRRRLLLPETRVVTLGSGQHDVCLTALAGDPRFRIVQKHTDGDCRLDRFFLASSAAIEVVIMQQSHGGPPDATDLQQLGARRKAIRLSENVPVASPTGGKQSSDPSGPSSSEDPLDDLDALLLHAAATWDCGDVALGSVADEFSRALHARQHAQSTARQQRKR